MVQTTKQDEIFALRFKREKMLKAQEQGLNIDFGMTLHEVINKIADLDAQILAEMKGDIFPATDCFDEQQERKTAICAATSF